MHFQMKSKIAFFLSALFFAAILTFNSQKLQSHIAQPATGGLAGDPGQLTCIQCHNDIYNGAKRPSMFSLHLAPDSAGLAVDSNLIISGSKYIPAHLQWVSIHLNGINTNAVSGGHTPDFGFQFTALKLLSDSMAGHFNIIDAKTSRESSLTSLQPVLVPGDTIWYVGHAHADTTRSWYFQWMAPDTGAVVFYFSGNLGNGDGTYNGDSIFWATDTLYPGPHSTVGLSAAEANIHYVRFYPMPLGGEQLNAAIYLINGAEISLQLLSPDGKMLRDLFSGAVPAGLFRRSFDMSGLPAGTYLINLTGGAERLAYKVVVD